MHIQTHILSGWCVGNCVRLDARGRLFCMIAASMADVDGLGIVLGQKFYWDYHHKLGHNVFFGIAISILLAMLSRQRLKMFSLSVALFHLHLLMDYYGSGPGWHIHYLWPAASMVLRNPNAWEFFSWQNLLAFLLLLLWTLWIALQRGRTPIEAIAPRLDQETVTWLQRAARRSPTLNA